MIGWYGCEKEVESGYVLRVTGYVLRVTGFVLRIADNGVVSLNADYL